MAHRRHLLARELARVHVGAQHGGQQARLIVELGGQRPLVATVLCALLHGGQYACLLAFRYAAKSDGWKYNKKETQLDFE